MEDCHINEPERFDGPPSLCPCGCGEAYPDPCSSACLCGCGAMDAEPCRMKKKAAVSELALHCGPTQEKVETKTRASARVAR